MSFTTTPYISLQPDDPTDDLLVGKLKALLSIDFTAHDARLTQCIVSARKRIEKATGVLLSPATVTVRWKALYDWEYLPWGPVTGEVTATDLLDAVVSAGDFDGDFPVVFGDYVSGIKLSYHAGYDNETMPDDLREAVLNLAANLFDSGERNWFDLVIGHRRYSWAS